MEIPSPSKPLSGFEASLQMKCYVVSAPSSAPSSAPTSKTRAIKSTVGKDPSYKEGREQVVDLFASKDDDNLEFYIFNPVKFPVSSNAQELKSSRENLLKEIRERAKDNSSIFRCQRTSKKPPTSIEKEEGRLFYQSDLYCVRSIVNKVNKASGDSEYSAYSSTNGKRKLFADPKGNRKKNA